MYIMGDKGGRSVNKKALAENSEGFTEYYRFL